MRIITHKMRSILVHNSSPQRIPVHVGFFDITEYQEADIKQMTRGVSIPLVSIRQNFEARTNSTIMKILCGWLTRSFSRDIAMKMRVPRKARIPKTRVDTTTPF
jgi:hypothetical protein